MSRVQLSVRDRFSRHHVLILMLLQAAFTTALSAQPAPETQEAPKARIAIPSAEQQTSTEALVRDVHASDFKKTDSADRRALAAKLIEEAKQSTDTAEKYVLLRDARDIAMASGAAGLALDAIDAEGETFDVKTIELAVESVLKSAPKATTADSKDAVLDAASRVLDAAVAKDEYAAINQLAPLANAESVHGASDEKLRGFRARLVESRLLATEFAKSQTAAQKLKSQPDDAASNLQVGQFLCLDKGDWQRGPAAPCQGRMSHFAVAASHDLERSRPRFIEKGCRPMVVAGRNPEGPCETPCPRTRRRSLSAGTSGTHGAGQGRRRQAFAEAANDAWRLRPWRPPLGRSIFSNWLTERIYCAETG